MRLITLVVSLIPLKYYLYKEKYQLYVFQIKNLHFYLKIPLI